MSQYNFQMALQDFQAARRRAALEELLARLTGKSSTLLSYDEIARKLKLSTRSDRGTQNIPLNSIVGTVGRYNDFTRTFLPRRAEDEQRWARVKAAIEDSGMGLPPIEVYKVGDVYFVLDGNHRVSIARQEGWETIEAHVIEVHTEIPFTAELSMEELDAAIIEAEQVQFLDETHIAELRPNVDLSVTAPGQYEKLEEQIRVCQYLLQESPGDKATYLDAVIDWYDNIYIPLVEIIRDRGLLRWFPDRTQTDLFIWIYENRSELEKELGWVVRPESLATALVARESPQARSLVSESGHWRESRLIDRYTENLFRNILVPLSGDNDSWSALEQAIVVAKKEGAVLHGLHVVNSSQEKSAPFALRVQERFNEICRQSDVEGSLAIEEGTIAEKIDERGLLTDLIVLKISFPPKGGMDTLSSPFRTVINHAPCPVLGLQGGAGQFKRGLLAFDGSPRSREALFVATYMAEIWKTELIVFTAREGVGARSGVQDYANRYLELHEVEADYVVHDGNAKETLQRLVEERGADFVLMGAYSRSALQDVFIGSSLDHMLRESDVPLVICR